MGDECFPGKSGLDIFVSVMRWIAILSGGAVAICSLLLLIFKGGSMNVFGAITRTYALLFGVMVVLGELRWRKFLLVFGFLRTWLIRGVFAIFVGLLHCNDSGIKNECDDCDACTFGPDNKKVDYECIIVLKSSKITFDVLLRFIPGGILAIAGLIFFVAGIIFLCKGQADPGMKEAAEDEAGTAMGQLKSAGNKAKDKGNAAYASASASATTAAASAQQGVQNAQARASEAYPPPPPPPGPPAKQGGDDPFQI